MSDETTGRPVVWITDDSAMERAITRRALGEGYVYEEFQDGSEVVERLSAPSDFKPDVLLLDWVMPGMTGDEVCKFLRSRSHTQDLPIIMVTASRVETGDVVKGLALGANDYVARPFAAEELRARVEAVLRTKQLSDAARAERKRLATINRLGHALFEAGTSVELVLEKLATTLIGALCDGCAITLLPGRLPMAAVAHHHTDSSVLAAIGTFADPDTFSFADADEAKRTLPPAYHTYVDTFGLRGLAIFPFPILTPVEGIVTVTRDANSEPFDSHDLGAIETCIEYASLAVERALRTEAERATRDRMLKIVQHAPVGILLADANGVISEINPAIEEMIPGIQTARRLADVLALGEWSGPDGPLTAATWSLGRSGTERDAPLRSELTLRPRNGGPSRRLAVSTSLLEEADAPAGTVTAVEDVTVQRVMQEERERVALFQEQMLGIVGHDLRNPLGAILNGAAMIAHHIPDNSQVMRIVKMIDGSSQRMARIVDQLLDVTRARLGGGLVLRRTEVSLRTAARAVLDELATVHPKMSFDLAPGPDVVGLWDADRIGQVLSNLGGNAAQYGAPEVPVTMAVTTDAEGAVLRVHNGVRGAAIPAERLASLFEPYRRGGDQARHVAGLGLGLYIVSEIVRAHGGTIEAESTVAGGTIFTVRLPLRAAMPAITP